MPQKPLFGLLRLLAIVAMLALFPLFTHAHEAGGQYGSIPEGTAARGAQEAGSHPHDADCMAGTIGMHLHCHPTPPDPQAGGVIQFPDDPPVPIAWRIFPVTHQPDATAAAISSRVPIPGPPRFILFGSFRI